MFFDFWEDRFTEQEILLFLNWSFDPNIISFERIHHEFDEEFYRDMKNFDKMTDPLLNWQIDTTAACIYFIDKNFTNSWHHFDILL